MLDSCNQSFTPPEGFCVTADPILQKVHINIEQAWFLESNTTAQAQDKKWFQEREIRLTASNFGKALYRKKEPSEPFLKSIFEPNDLSKVSSVQHGKQNEVIVRSIYIENNFAVYEYGLVVKPSYPYLGASPDGKVFDPTFASPFGLLEIKYTWRNHSIKAACQDLNFPCEMINGYPG